MKVDDVKNQMIKSIPNTIQLTTETCPETETKTRGVLHILTLLNSS